jgi:hypothetical protein
MTSFKYIAVVLSLFLAFGFAKAEYLMEDDLKSLVVSCYLENEAPVFCSEQKIDDPHLKIYLPLFKSVMVQNKVHAFRIMATIENLSKRNLIGAKIKLKIKNTDNTIVEFIINEKIKYKMSSKANYSHLIRSDIPKIQQSYQVLHSAYYNADISNFEMVISELHFD